MLEPRAAPANLDRRRKLAVSDHAVDARPAQRDTLQHGGHINEFLWGMRHDADSSDRARRNSSARAQCGCWAFRVSARLVRVASRHAGYRAPFNVVPGPLRDYAYGPVG